MNGYDLSRNFWNWAFDNPEKISPNHAAIYFFAVEHCNRLGGKEKFGFPSQMTMDAIGIKKHSTYIKYFNDLIDFGFFKLIQKSSNQYSANIISLISAKPKMGKALDKAFMNHAAKQTESMGQSNGKSKRSIDKQLNKEQLNNYTYKNFYDSELEKNKDDNYTKFVKVLFGENETGEVLENILNIKKQVTYRQFLTILEYKKKYKISIANILQDMNNRPDLTKNYTSLPTTILSWIRKRAKDEK